MRHARWMGGAVALAIAFGGCAPDAMGPVPVGDIHFTVVSGGSQSGTVGTTLTTPLVVRATTSSNAPIPNVYVNFEVTAGGGTVFATAVQTDASGNAQDIWTLGPTAGTQHVEVRRIDPSTKTAQTFGVFTATANAAAAAKLVTIAGVQQDGNGGFAVGIAPTVQVTDQYGNPKAGASVTFTVATGGGSVSGTSGSNVTSTTQTTASDGTAKPTSWTLGGAPGINSLTASSGTLGGSPTTFLANALFSVKAISSGSQHSCELRADGAAFCSGQNSLGELGIGSTVAWQRMTPAGGGLTFSTISVGGVTSCALAPGKAYCWGLGSSGQLGIGLLVNQSVPVTVQSSVSFKAISVGEFHVCAISTSGAAYCWGDNSHGQLGINSTVGKTVPVAVDQTATGPLTFAQISAGNFSTCGVTTSGVGYCWGDNVSGELGTGGTEAAIAPEKITGGHVWKQISVGVSHACGITTSNATYCWGYNSTGQLGNGTTTATPNGTPVLVSGGLTFQQVEVSLLSTCALTTSGKGYCWGGNGVGQLGDGTLVSRTTPVAVATGQLFASLGSADDYGQCAVAKGGGAPWCWGNNSAGQLGTGSSPTIYTTPFKVLSP